MAEQIIQQVREWCRERAVRLCVLFGSQTTGRARPASDVDLAVWPETPPDTEMKLTWLRELEEMLGKSVSLALVTPDLIRYWVLRSCATVALCTSKNRNYG